MSPERCGVIDSRVRERLIAFRPSIYPDVVSDPGGENFTMKPVAVWLLVGGVLLIAPFTRIEVSATRRESSDESSRPASCAGPEYHEFDFWVGDWDAFDVDDPGKVVARNRVNRILDGCVLLEDYQGTNGSKGQSFTIYDASRRVWHQTWVTNRGQLLTIEGKMHDGEMVLSGADLTADGKERQVRGVWKSVNGAVRETAVTSTDGGKTWEPWFDLWFRPHKP
jgi:hypothetical protein